MAKYQKLVNKADRLMTAWAAAYERFKRFPIDPGFHADLNNARNALLGFIGSLAGRNDQQQEVIDELLAGVEALTAELATYKPQIPDGMPFDLEAAKRGEPMQVRVTTGDQTEWIAATLIGVRGDGSLVYETDQYGMMHSKIFAAFRMVPQTEQVTLWANAYRAGDGQLWGNLYPTADIAEQRGRKMALSVAAFPVTFTVVK